MKALLFSNSTNAGEEYLNYTLPYIRDFLKKEAGKALFIPYAAITISYDDYYRMVAMNLARAGITVSSIHTASNPQVAIESAELIIIGGGNTFQLISCLQKEKLIETIRKKVHEGIPYIGWSAGSNVACPTISTTNDMPVTEPESFAAIGLVPFQINPHYTDITLPNFNGETREMRIKEYIQVNQHVYVAGLLEGSLFEINGNSILLKGTNSCRIFRYGSEPKEMLPDADFSFLMQ
jgi:dipeptidase E